MIFGWLRFGEPRTTVLGETEIANMNKIFFSFITLLACSFIVGRAWGAALSDKDKEFLSAYTKVQAALAGDDLAATKSAAAALGSEGSELAKASSLQEARVSFEKLSTRAKTLADGDNGYHIFYCPMLKKDWVQTSTTAANPYAGKSMLTCGEMKK